MYCEKCDVNENLVVFASELTRFVYVAARLFVSCGSCSKETLLGFFLSSDTAEHLRRLWFWPRASPTCPPPRTMVLPIGCRYCPPPQTMVLAIGVR